MKENKRDVSSGLEKYMNTDIVFRCRKCGHLLFVSNFNINKAEEISGMSCPKCGEEGYGNWVLLRIGNYEKEYGE